MDQFKGGEAIYVAFGVYMMVASYEIVIFEALPFLLSLSDKRPSTEYVEVERHLRGKLATGIRLDAVFGYRRLVPLQDRRVLFCIDRGWTTELSGQVGKWGLNLDQFIA